MGQVVIENTISKEVIDVSDLSNGVYFLEIKIKGTKVSKRFIKQ